MTRVEAREPGSGRRRTRTVLRLAIGAILFVTAIGKLLDVPGFARVLGTYRALPDAAVFPAAVAVPAAELLLALWLFSDRRPLGAAVAALLMHLAYAAWSATAILRGLALPNCGCFGVFLPRPLGWSTVAEDLVVAGACAWLAAAARAPSGDRLA
ncbi:MAG: MauE/DoxX family redox-associated membrane protein [Acidobacteriota bacterium]